MGKHIVAQTGGKKGGSRKRGRKQTRESKQGSAGGTGHTGHGVNERRAVMKELFVVVDGGG